MTATQSRIPTTGDLSINVHAWTPAGALRGVVAIVPGFNSHGGYYEWTANQLVASGYAVYAVDLRGRGKSDGERFYVASSADYVSDVHAMVTYARGQQPNLPVFLLGHSAGGVVGCLYTLEHGATLAGFVCESFAFKIPAPDFALAALRGLAHLAPHAHVLRLKNEDFSRDPAIVAAMNADPLIEHETQSTQTVAELARADERLEKSFGSITLPVLILHGTLDKATKPSGSEQFYANAGSADKTLKLYEGHYHDLLNDIGREQVMSDITAWIDARIAKS